MNSSLFLNRIVNRAQQIPIAFWIVLMLAIPTGAAGFAWLLLGEAQNDECQGAQRSLTLSDSSKLYCAQSIAHQQTPEALIDAIQLADSMARNHPLRGDGDRLIRQWSNRLLELGENAFQTGELDQAIKLAEGIPSDIELYDTAIARTQAWKKIWDEAQTIHDAAQSALQSDELVQAFAEARKLLIVKNQYWSTTRFQELVNEIQASKESKKDLANKKPTKEKTVLASAFSATSTDELLSDWQREQEQDAINQLNQAEQLAVTGRPDDLKAAVRAAELVFSGTSRYGQAQKRIADWTRQLETTEDQPYLDRANKLASKGDLASLQAAISEANNVYFGRALYQEAQAKIDVWTQQVRELHAQQYSQKNPPSVNLPLRETDYQIAPTSTNP